MPPGGGPPPHIHRNEDETFYIVEGQIDFLLGDETVTGGPGDFVNVPRGTVHRFRNSGTSAAKMILTQHRALLRGDARASARRHAGRGRQPRRGGGRYAAAAPRYGMVFLD